jgi:hypothetical protein
MEDKTRNEMYNKNIEASASAKETIIVYIKMNVCLYVCLYLIQIHISEPI